MLLTLFFPEKSLSQVYTSLWNERSMRKYSTGLQEERKE